MTDEELEAPLDDKTEADIARAVLEARDYFDDEVATSVRFIAAEDSFLIVLRSGRRVFIPREDLQGLAGISAEDAAGFALEGANSVIVWERADVAFPVKALADGLWGSSRWMRKLEERRSAAYAA